LPYILETKGVPESLRVPGGPGGLGGGVVGGGHRAGADALCVDARGGRSAPKRSAPLEGEGAAWVVDEVTGRTRLGIGTIAQMHREAAALVRELGVSAAFVLEEIARALERQDQQELMRISRAPRRAA
jgi:hypothetical protein